MKILIASNNKNKVKEIKKLFSEFKGIEVISLQDFDDHDDVEENGVTFSENAYIKAKYYYDKYNVTTISDDSGLVVPALNGDPGVYSARYSGMGDEANNDLLLKNMENIKDRSAYYQCDICFYDGKTPQYFVGKLTGQIGYERKGTGGFGYDPLFIVDERTLAEIDLDEKNKISHRAIAIGKFLKYFKENFIED